MELPIEDEFSDVIGKAQKGQGVSTEALAEKSGVSEDAIRSLRKGDFDGNALESVGRALGLNTEALLSLGRGEWRPEVTPPSDGFAMVNTPFYDLHVNAYVAWDTATREAIAFDTGTDGQPMIDLIKQKGLSLKTIFLTHAHDDHIEGLGAVVDAFGCEVLCPKGEDRVPGAVEFVEGEKWKRGHLGILAMDTPGHTEGGTTFLVEGLDKSLAIVGDALFSGSMGGANISYEKGLASLQRILDLPPETILASGHGPLTTVAQERGMNCFFVA